MKTVFLLLALSLGACATTQPAVKPQDIQGDMMKINFKDGTEIVRTNNSVCFTRVSGPMINVRCYY